MKQSFALIVMTILAHAFSEANAPTVPLESGEYVFQHRFAEQPSIPSIKLQVTVDGSRITVVNPTASDPFPTGTLAEGQIMWHAASQQWIIGHEDSDKLASDVGGCSDGPEVIDLVNKIYWTC